MTERRLLTEAGFRTDTYPYQAVVQLTVTFANGERFTGSGVIVGNNDILTAAHVIYSPTRGAAVRIEVTPGRDGDRRPYGTFEASSWWFNIVDEDGDGRLTNVQAGADLAMVSMSFNIGAMLGWWGLDPNFSSGNAYVVGYPTATGMRPTIEFDHVFATQGYLDLGAFTISPGNSGGPVFIFQNNDPYVIGVVSTTLAAADVGGAYWNRILGWMRSNDYLLGQRVDGTAASEELHGRPDTAIGDNFDGGAGNDGIYGYQGNDTLAGGAGNDTVLGGDGNDQVFGGDGNDRLLGNAGNDWIDGDLGNDTVYGGDGNDSVRGLDGNDWIEGGIGADDLNGNTGNDTIYGGDGNDPWVRGGRDNDVVYGGSGNDPHVNGNIGNDTVYGDDGDDGVFGGQDQDLLYGGFGNDTLSGDLGNDTLWGGPGADRFVFRDGGGSDRIGDFSFSAGDRIVIPIGVSVTITTGPTGDAVVTLSNGVTITLAGIAPGTVAGEWFLFG